MERKFFTVFRRGENRFAVDSSAVREIAGIGTVTPVPRASPWFSGLLYVRGDIVPVYDPSLRLGLPASVLPFGRIILINAPSGLTGIGTDGIDGIFPESTFSVERGENMAGKAGAGFVRAFLKTGTESPIIELDLSKFFVPEEKGKKSGVHKKSAPVGTETASRSTAGREPSPETALLTAYIGPEEYGFLLKSVVEVVKSDGLARIPEKGTAAGVITIRDRLLPVTDLRKIPGFSADDPESRVSGETASGVVVLSKSGVETGVLVDRFGRIVRVPGSLEDLARGFYGSKTGLFHGIARPGGGNRLIFIIKDEKLFEGQSVRNGPDGGKEEKVIETTAGNLHRVLVFRSGDNRFCLGIEDVLEVGRIEELSSVPKAPAYFAGMVPFHGEPVPVINLKELFNLAPSPDASSGSRIVFIRFGNRTVGILVDSVSEVRRIPDDRLQPVPAALASGVDINFLKGIYSLPETDGFLMLIDAGRLLSREEEKTIVREESNEPDTRPDR